MRNKMEKENVFCGDLVVKEGEIYPYTEITGDISSGGEIKAGAFPVLQTNGGDISSGGGIKAGAFPVLQTNGGYIYSGGGTIKAGAFPVLQTNGGYISSGGGIKAGAFPVLQTNGGYISSGGGTIEAEAFPVIRNKNDPRITEAVKQKCRAMLLSTFAAAGFSFADGILARIVSQRGNVARVVICGKTEVSYVVTDGEGNYSHGDTLDEAREDLMVKRTSKDLSQFKSWTLDKEVSKSGAIMAYRSITGACRKGTRHWLEQHKTPEKITVSEIIKITEGAYRADIFKKFFAKGE
jgi:hypothetical protein